MKTKSILLLVGLLAVSGAGVATATAFLVEQGSAQATLPIDHVMILELGKTGFTNISGLTPGAAVTRSVVVKKPVVTTSTWAARVFFGLTPNAECSIDGLTLEVSTKNLATEAYDETDLLFTLGGSASNSDQININNSFVETTYYIRASITQEAYDAYLDVDATTQFGGTLTLQYTSVDTFVPEV